MKKIMLLAAVLCVSGAVFAAQKTAVRASRDGHKPAMEQVRGEGHQAFEKAHKEQKAKMKAKQEKMEKLVKEYKGLKDGKKKEEKRAEIEKEVASIREEQLKFKQEQLGKFDERLEQMKQEFAQDNTAQDKQTWVTQKTDALIEQDGNLKALFDKPEGRKGPQMGGKPVHDKGPHKGMRGHGEKGPHMPGARGFRPEGSAQQPDELTVQHPAAK